VAWAWPALSTGRAGGFLMSSDVQTILRELAFQLERDGIYAHESYDPDRLYVVLDGRAITLTVTSVDMVS
jgi:hypothetical protein